MSPDRNQTRGMHCGIEWMKSGVVTVELARNTSVAVADPPVLPAELEFVYNPWKMKDVRRLYINLADGTKVGFLDLATLDAVPESGETADLLQRALAGLSPVPSARHFVLGAQAGKALEVAPEPIPINVLLWADFAANRLAPAHRGPGGRLLPCRRRRGAAHRWRSVRPRTDRLPGAALGSAEPAQRHRPPGDRPDRHLGHQHEGHHVRRHGQGGRHGVFGRVPAEVGRIDSPRCRRRGGAYVRCRQDGPAVPTAGGCLVDDERRIALVGGTA